ncbi:MAG: hypothetical protein NT169_15560 [Chloroflexi bacterium]|nr:hypothetical protein [Chloroflexota bacterium]
MPLWQRRHHRSGPDRAREIRKLREQGETLANIGRRFGLSAERVRQILAQEALEVFTLA